MQIILFSSRKVLPFLYYSGRIWSTSLNPVRYWAELRLVCCCFDKAFSIFTSPFFLECSPPYLSTKNLECSLEPDLLIFSPFLLSVKLLFIPKSFSVTNWFPRKQKYVLLWFWRSYIQNGFCWAKIKVLAGLYSSWRLWGRVHSLAYSIF